MLVLDRPLAVLTGPQYPSGTIAPTVIRRYPPCNPGATPSSTPLLDRDDAGFIASVLRRTIDGAGN